MKIEFENDNSDYSVCQRRMLYRIVEATCCTWEANLWYCMPASATSTPFYQKILQMATLLYVGIVVRECKSILRGAML